MSLGTQHLGCVPLRRTRRQAVAGVAALAGAAGVAACGGAERSPAASNQAPVSIDWFFAGNSLSDETKGLIERFREKHPNVTPVPGLGGDNNDNGYRAKLQTLVASDTAPDVFYLEWFVYPPYVVNGALADVDTLAKRDKLPLTDLWPSFAKQFAYKGKLWAFTQGMQTMVTWYNVDQLEQAGVKPPTKGTTWAQYVELSQKLTVRQGNDFARFGTTFWRSLHQPPGAFMFMAGGRLFDRQEDPQGSTFHEPAEQEGLGYLGELVNKHRVAPTGPEETAAGGNEDGFVNGKFALNMRNVPINIWETKIKDFRWSAAPLPSGRGGQFSVSNGHGMCMAAATKKKDAAWTFLGWYGGTDGQTVLAQNNTICGLRSVAQKHFLTQPKYAAIKSVILESVENGKYFPNTPKIRDALQLINPTMAQVFNGQLTPREAGEKLRKEIDAILQGR